MADLKTLLTSSAINSKRSLILSLHSESNLWVGWVGQGDGTLDLLLHATVAELDTVVWNAGQDSLARRQLRLIGRSLHHS